MSYTTSIATRFFCLVMGVFLFLFAGCDKTEADIYSIAGGCYALKQAEESNFLVLQDGTYGFAKSSKAAAPAFRMRASDLGHYVLYDTDKHYFIAQENGTKTWELKRTSDHKEFRIDFHQEYSDAEWSLESAQQGENVYHLRHLNSDKFLGQNKLVTKGDALQINLSSKENCAIYPEMSLDASGTIRKEAWPNGDVYGFADIHSHLLTNEGFGGGGIFHGAPYHPLGVEHALTDCTEWHGENGQRDLVDYFLSGNSEISVDKLGPIFSTGRVDEFNHATTGYPVFADWPNPRENPTHQQQYYKWLQRSYLGGLRLIVQLATGNSALCELMVGLGSQTAPYTCNDMISVDRTIKAARGMERYIDAQAGGPGKGWFKIVETPADARNAINDGKLAVVLGIEISNVFDCFVVAPDGMPECDVEHVRSEVKEYYQKGIRVIFPVHKYDNGFAGGDGQGGAIEIGNTLNSGHYGNKISECPDFHHNFDSGPIDFGGLNKPRDAYFSEPHFDMSGLADQPLLTLLPIVNSLAGSGLEGDYCQAQGLTQQGIALIEELMGHGMIIDIAHVPRWATLDAFELMDKRKYPAISTHGLKYDGRIYKYGGLSNKGFHGCGRVGEKDTMGEKYREETTKIQKANGLPSPPLAFDLNGFAGSRHPRFGENSHCPQPQANPVTYPFKSFDGNIEFSQPKLGNRVVDFNTEGILHVGLFPELVEDIRGDGMTDADLEPLFRSAESFIRTWEKIESSAGR